VTFSLERTDLATIHNVTVRRRQTDDRRQTQHCSISATVLSTVG